MGREGASVAVFRFDGPAPRVCLVRRGRAPYAGCWSLPGGRVEASETPADAARRELKEETGLKVDIILPVRVAAFDEPSDGLRLHVHAARWAGGEPKAADDAEAATFAPLDALPSPLTPHLNEAIAVALSVITKA